MATIVSDFETQWNRCPPAAAIVQQRIFAFDSYSAITYGPATADYQLVQLSNEQPSDEWIVSALDAFVRGEFGSGEAEVPSYPGLPEIARGRADGDEHYRYLQACERSLIYSSHLEALIEKGGQSIPERVRALIADKRLGNEANRRNTTQETFDALLAPLVADHLRLRFVMPAFPFKDQNPFRTAAPAHQPDLGEIALLIRLHCLALALWHVHSDGADWIVLSDGVVYSSIFGVDSDDAREYVSRLRLWRDELNMQRTVAIVDLADLIQRADTATDGSRKPITATRAHIRSTLETADREAVDTVTRNLAVLQRGMARNLNTRGMFGRIPAEDLWLITRGAPERLLREPSSAAYREIMERARNAAFEYAAVNLAMRYHDVLNRYLPNTIRATIHAKPGQIAAPSLGRVFPWNGVALVRGDSFDDRSLSVSALHDLTARYATLIERNRGDDSPLYYTLST